MIKNYTLMNIQLNNTELNVNSYGFTFSIIFPLQEVKNRYNKTVSRNEEYPCNSIL